MLTSLLLTAVASFAAPAQDTLTVTLPLEAHVEGTEIELGELAELAGTDKLVERLSKLEIGYSPSPGYSRLLRVDQVRTAIKRKAPEVSVRFAGQRATRVWPAVEEVEAEALLAAAREALLRHVGATASDLTPRGDVQSIEVPKTPEGATLRARVEAESGTVTTVAVEVLVDAGLYRTVWTSWHAERWIEVPVLSRGVAAGEIFNAGHFRVERRSVAGVAPAALAPEALIGTTAVRALEAGALVRLADIRRAFAVQAGSNLMLSVKKGAIEARVPAVAQEACVIGNRLRVRIVSSDQEMTAKLVSPDLAEIDLGS